MERSFMRAKDVAEALGFAVGTIYNFRLEGCPVASEKPLRFDLDVVIAWLKTRKRGK